MTEDEPLSITNIDWREFERRLTDFANAGVPCDSNERCTLSRKILADMGLSESAISECVAFFHEHGGYCDCEVAFNVLDELVEIQRPRLLH